MQRRCVLALFEEASRGGNFRFMSVDSDSKTAASHLGRDVFKLGAHTGHIITATCSKGQQLHKLRLLLAQPINVGIEPCQYNISICNIPCAVTSALCACGSCCMHVVSISVCAAASIPSTTAPATTWAGVLVQLCQLLPCAAHPRVLPAVAVSVMAAEYRMVQS